MRGDAARPLRLPRSGFVCFPAVSCAAIAAAELPWDLAGAGAARFGDSGDIAAVEDFGLVFLEALAFRKPIIAAGAAGAVDVVSAGEHGPLIDGEHELAATIATLVRDRELAHRMGEAGYRAVGRDLLV